MLATDALHQTLKDLMAAIEGGDGEGLRRHLAELDRHRDGLSVDAPTMLRHYLEKRSYAKAVDFREGRDETAQPNC